MPDLSRQAPDNPDFARVLELRALPEAEDFVFDIAPEAAEAEALARLMGARSVRKMRFQGRLSPLPGSGWGLEGKLGATVVQTCVVSLEPVTTRIDTQVRRRFLPGRALAAEAAGVVVSLDEDDEVEPLGPRIDLGLVATEALALALPDYPRKTDAGLSATLDTDAAADEEPAPRPFAALAALRDKLGNSS